MQFSQSLKENYIFRRLYAKGNSSANRYLALYCRKNRQSVNRVGITVSAKLGCAVVRNRIRRRLREIYRLNEQAFLPGYDLVVVARSQAVTASYRQLERAYLNLAGRLGLLRGAPAKPPQTSSGKTPEKTILQAPGCCADSAGPGKDPQEDKPQ